MAAIWVTPPGNLGIIPELEFYQLRINAYDTDNLPLTYSLISGALPEGLQLEANGIIAGIPVQGLVEGVPASVTQVTTSEFTFRATNSNGQVTDRTFSLTIAGIKPPIITPKNVDLGSYFDGSFYSLQLYAIELNQGLSVSWSLLDGELPPGITLTPEGLLQGYIEKSISNTIGVEGFELEAWDFFGWDFVAGGVNRTYEFTIKADDTVNFDISKYTLSVYALSLVTADNTNFTVDNNNAGSGINITADLGRHTPILLNLDTTIGDLRQGSNFAYKFEGFDLDSDPIRYRISSGALPTGLSLNPTNGWLTGLVPFGSLGSINYTFGVQVFKRDRTEYASEEREFTIDLLGQINDVVIWNTASDLGTIGTGFVSTFSVSASTPSRKSLFYRLLPGSDSKLPQGLQLLTDGSISGRVTFETFKIDENTTTFDAGRTLTTFDKTYSFLVQVYDGENSVTSTRRFSITIFDTGVEPYENLYIKAMPTRDQRTVFNQIINNSDIFPPDDLYRPGDPWFGVNTRLSSLFLAGLNPESAADYIAAIEQNHYWKKINFGEIKTARALDSTLNTEYEVVYLELYDNATNEQGESAPQSITWPENTQGITTVYPNSFANMAQNLIDDIGYENQNTLPGWMTSRQTNGKVLGFTRALVLAYAKPGKSAAMAYRLEPYLTDLQLIDFTIDRYEWDDTLSTWFNKQTREFITDPETTFDAILYTQGTGRITTSTASDTVLGYSSVLYSNPTANISTSNGSPVVGGINTTFLSNISAGQYLINAENDTIIGQVNNITGNLSLTLRNGAPATYTNINCAVTSTTFENLDVDHQLYAEIDGVGNISMSNTSNILTGIGTQFAVDLNPGDYVIVDSSYYRGAHLVPRSTIVGRVYQINSNTNVTLTDTARITASNHRYKHTSFVGNVELVNNNISLLITANSAVTASNVTYGYNSTETVFDGGSTRFFTAREQYTTPGQGNTYLKFPQVNVLH